MKPLVSVVIPTFNNATGLNKAITSVLSQTWQDFEVLVVNDGGEVLKQINDARIRYLNHTSNLGRSAARNTGLESATGRYIAYLDDDDQYLPNHLETLVKALEESEYSVAYTDAFAIRVENGAFGTPFLEYSLDFSYPRLLTSNFIPILCLMHRRECLEFSGGFDVSMHRLEDWDLWIRLGRHYPFVHVPTVTAHYTVGEVDPRKSKNARLSFDWAELQVYCKHHQLVGESTSVATTVWRQFAEAVERIIYALREDAKNVSYLCAGSAQDTVESLDRLMQEGPEEYRAPLSSLQLLLRSIGGSVTRRGSSGFVVSIVVPVYNAYSYTKLMLETLLPTIEHRSDVELILVDNASTDEIPMLLEKLKHKATIISNPENRNFSGACNQGAAIARGENVLFLNTDVILLDGWLDPMVRLMVSDPLIGIVGNRHLFPETGRLHHAGICIHEDLSNSHYLVGVDAQDPRVSYIREFQAINGACFLVSRGLFRRLDGFDEGFRNGYEDVDLCLRARKLGFKVMYTPESTIMHFGQRSPGRNTTNDSNLQFFLDRWRGKLKPDMAQLQREDAQRFSSTRGI